MTDDIWDSLCEEAQKKQSSGIFKRLVVEDSAYPVFYGITTPEQHFCFIVQLPVEEMHRFERFPKTRGFNLITHIAGEELVKGNATLNVTASSAQYNGVFKAIALDISKSVSAVTGAENKTLSLIRRLNLWRSFFERQTEAGLSSTDQQGLYGELYFLRNHLLSLSVGAGRVLATWTGPDKRQHDFQLGKVAVEVKTSSQRTHQKAIITSEQQLDETLVSSLYLYWLCVVIVENDKNTLPALVGDLRHLLNSTPEAAEFFENSLLASGYTDAEQNLYATRSYSVVKESIFEVKERFPRIRISELRTGVSDVEYSISEGACIPFAVNIEKLSELLLEALS